MTLYAISLTHIIEDILNGNHLSISYDKREMEIQLQFYKEKHRHARLYEINIKEIKTHTEGTHTKELL